MSEIKYAYQGEARLLRWADSGGAGRTITIQLDEEGDVHPFKHLLWGSENGQRMKIACVLVDDHEQPLAPENARRKRGKKSPGSLNGRTPTSRAQLAGMWIKDWHFQYWLGVHPQVAQENRITHADKLLKDKLGIVSKKELDSDPAKGAAWDALWTDYQVRDLVRA